MTDVRPAIRRALQRPCSASFLKPFLVPKPRLGGTRPAFARLFRLVAVLEKNGPSNASRLSALLNTCTKTIYRDIVFLRDGLGYPVTFDRLKRSYQLGQIESGRITLTPSIKEAA